MYDFLSWDILVTFTGASVATVVLTQFLKGILAKIPTQIVSYLIALVILTGTTLMAGGVEHWVNWAIVPLNAMLVSLTANGEYAMIKRLFEAETPQG